MKRTCLDELQGEHTGKRLKFQEPCEETKQEEPELTRNIRIMKEMLTRAQREFKMVLKPQQNQSKSLPKSTTLFQPMVVLHNWISTPKATTNCSNKPLPQRFLSLDCEFVQCGNRHALARISIVDEQCKTVLDSYVRPTERITNFITFVSGITYEHIKHATTWQELRPKVESLLRNCSVVGHTTHSDLKVMEMEGWKGFRSVIDISKCSVYRDEQNRIQGLKKLAAKHLSHSIQKSSHCSVEDASATMKLFLLNKPTILREQQFI